MTRVYIISGSMQGRYFALKENTALIGRGISNDIQIVDSSVSRKHAKIFKDNDKYFVEDLRSKNGTWINGNAIDSDKSIEVQEGVPIAIGKVLISLGNRCSMDCLATQYLSGISRRAEDRDGSPSFRDRRMRNGENVELIYNVSLTLMQSLDVKEICKNVLDSLFYCLKRIDSGFILLVEPEGGELREIAARWRNAAESVKPNYSRTIVNRVLSEGKAIMMPDTSLEDEDDLSDSIENMGVKSLMCVPLISKVGTRGVIYVQSVNVAHGFRKDDLFLLTGLSTPAALAIENALLYSERRQVGEELKKARDDLEKVVKERTAELIKANKKLEELSITDGLTGLYNYRHLMRSLDSEYSRSVRHHHNLSLIMMDIDYFKDLNDTYGHLCGDFVIRKIALLLKENVRSTDLVARYGGDEIAVILLETDQKNALKVAKKLKEKIQGCSFDWRRKPLDVGISIGVATAPSAGIEKSDDLLNAADQALYRAKESGKNSVFASQPHEKKK